MEAYAPQRDRYFDDWEKNMNVDDKVKMLAKLDMLEDLANYIDMLREGYTRTLKINHVEDDGTIKEPKIEHFPISSISLDPPEETKERHKGVKGLDGDLEMIIEEEEEQVVSKSEGEDCEIKGGWCS